jgi:hypothetical protein
VFSAAVIGIKVSKNTDKTSIKISYKRNPFRCALKLVILATLFGIVQMHFEHKFHKGIRKLHKNLRPDQDFSTEMQKVEHHKKDD